MSGSLVEVADSQLKVLLIDYISVFGTVSVLVVKFSLGTMTSEIRLTSWARNNKKPLYFFTITLSL